MKEQQERWHLDKRVPIALIITIGLQTGAFVWWASDINARVNTLERRAEITAPQAERLVRVETKVESIDAGIAEIKRLIRREP